MILLVAHFEPMLSIIPAIIAGVATIAAAGISAGVDAADTSDEDALAAQERMMEEARRVWEELPPAEQEQVTPEMLLGIAQRSLVEADPQAIEAQRSTLGELEQLSRPGLNAEDMAMLGQAQRRGGQIARGSREAALANLSARGMGGSNQELLASLQASQQGLEFSNQAEREAQANASRRALAALAQRGQLAGAMRGQSFDEGYARASAVDEFNRANTMYQQGLQQRNVDRTNDRAMAQAAGRAGQYGQSAGFYGDRYSEQQAQDAATMQGAIQTGYGIGSALGEGVEGATEDDEDEFSSGYRSGGGGRRKNPYRGGGYG